MNEQQRDHLGENSTKLLLDILSSSTSLSPPVRARTVVNAIYVAGIAFMVGIFLLLLWVNLFSRHCGCWHDTSVVNRFNRPWRTRRSITSSNPSSSSKARQQRIPSNADQFEA